MKTDGTPATPADIAGAPGRAAYVRGGYRGEAPEIRYAIADPKAAGLKKARTGTPMTEEQKAERREQIAGRKAWASAETVRREWLTGLLSRRTLPKEAPAAITEALTVHRFALAKALGDGNRLATQLLGLGEAEWGRDKLAEHAAAQPGKAGHVSLAIVLGGIEASTGRDDWHRADARVAAHLRRLAAWGYTLSDIEAAAAGTDAEPATADGE